MYFNFVASDHFEIINLSSIESFVNHFNDFQTVCLKDENELILLFELMGIHQFESYELNNLSFTKYWDLSSCKFPELNSQQFDKFYKNWVEKSNRDSDMNEYGNLIFLQGLSLKWNKLKFRLVIKEEI